MITDSSKKIYTISELTFTIKFLLENKLKMVSVKGEISNFKRQSSGHLYFSLKDKESQISAVLFKTNTKNLAKEPKDGDQIIATGEISVYAPRGVYQLVIKEITFLGMGELLLKLHELKEELKAKGFFDLSRKKPLPKLPKTIGVVTSPTGAVIQDIINILSRRYFDFHLILNPVKVQGEGAAEEIAKAIYDFNKYELADVLIVGRGGGSLEDLWAFNEKIVAEAIFNSKIPIISAVGHETDFSISDFVADIRAPTPSAAAEIVMSEKAQLIKSLKNYEKQIFHFFINILKEHKNRLVYLSSHPYLSSNSILLKPIQQLDEMRTLIDIGINHLIHSKKEKQLLYSKQVQSISPKQHLKLLFERLIHYRKNIENSLQNKLKFLKREMDVESLKKEIENHLSNLLKTKRSNFSKLISHLRSLDPKEVLKKGYTILFSEKENSIILSSKNISKNERVSILFHDGKIKAEVIDE